VVISLSAFGRIGQDGHFRSRAYDRDMNRIRLPWWEGVVVGLIAGVIGTIATYALDTVFPGNRPLIGAAILAIFVPFLAFVFWRSLWSAR
jgi:hypothetical protein